MDILNFATFVDCITSNKIGWPRKPIQCSSRHIMRRRSGDLNRRRGEALLHTRITKSVCFQTSCNRSHKNSKTAIITYFTTTNMTFTTQSLVSKTFTFAVLFGFGSMTSASTSRSSLRGAGQRELGSCNAYDWHNVALGKPANFSSYFASAGQASNAVDG